MHQQRASTSQSFTCLRVAPASSTIIPERTLSGSFCWLMLVYSHSLKDHHIKLAASSQDMCRTPHRIRHSVDISFHGVSSWYPLSPCFILMLPSSVLCSLQRMCSVLLSASAAVGLLLGGHVTGLSAVCELCVGHKIEVWSVILDQVHTQGVCVVQTLGKTARIVRLLKQV